MSNENKIKILIPNILTSVRLVLTPIIIILGLLDKMNLVLVLILIAALTDLFDGMLARKFHTVSELGAKLDAISDKVFAIGITLSLINKLSFIKYILILEIMIGILNLYVYYKTKKTKSLMIGKIKTVFLFTLLVLCFFHIFFNKIVLFKLLVNGFSYATINLQILSIIKYVINYFEISDEEPTIEKDKEENKEIEKTITIDSLKNLAFDVEDDDIY